MSSYLVELNDKEETQSVTLVLSSLLDATSLIENLWKYKQKKYVDLSLLSVPDVINVLEMINDKSELTFKLSHTQINIEFLKQQKDIQDIDYRDNTYLLSYAESNVDVYEKYQRLNRNVIVQKQSYELEIVESLLREQDKKNETVTMLERENQLLRQGGMSQNDDDLENRYLELMEKYKQSLKRLEQLRDSKLGKLQVAYWNKKRGY
ncbi:hypothetical protein JEODO184_01746 [Jeotgalicoccus meleagridis]|jgi:hypothetical protein|uniref:Uncharacterized protein n=2 Tax=Jeotgalicoccus meleagridis TaxID=2759181 RepID=A0A6V7RPW8_9STAP|nr:hypothetical protein JEODO184_01746 [Jeotgalicoccus meleagridis]